MRQAEEVLGAMPQKHGVAKGLFEGRFVADWVFPYPHLPNHQRADVERAVAELAAFCDAHLDPERIDREADIPRDVIEGTIETFTIVHVTPDGFLPPLALALIRAHDGTLLFAQGEDDTQLKIGREVFVRRMDGIFLFTVKSQLQKVQEAFARLWRGNLSINQTKNNRVGENR